MAKYLKPQTPLQHQSGDYIYPITSVDQIVTGNGERLNANLISINLNELVESDKTVLKPQNPMTKGSDYFYPLTSADQVIMDGGYRLNDIVGKVKKSTITLYANGWSAAAPYCYSVTVDGLSDKVNMKMLPHYPDDFEGKQAMKEETAKISFASRNGNILTFECWEEVPTIDIPVDIEIDITYPSKGLEVELNYSVVGGTTEPEEPTQNMIWIQTETPIGRVFFGNSEPNETFMEGDVWIYTGTISSVAFNSLKIGNSYMNMVYPLSAKQYVSGAWADKTAKSYQNSEWVDWWNGTLLEPNNQYTQYTGGWVADTRLVTWADSSKSKVAPTVTTNSDSITITEASSNKHGCYRTSNMVDLSGFESLKLDIPSASTTNGHIRVSVINKLDVATNGNAATFALIVDGSSPTTFSGTKTLDISALDGKYYIAITLTTYQLSSTSTIKLAKIYLE